MKKIFVIFLATITWWCMASAQKMATIEGKAGSDIIWTFDGQTLVLENTNIQKAYVKMPDYNVKYNIAPWAKRQLAIKKVIIGDGISNIGSCAFARCGQLETVEFNNEAGLEEIRWGAFLDCKRLFNFSIPSNIKRIGKIAFAGCTALRAVTIPMQTRVEDYAFLSCPNLNVLNIAINAQLGKAVFANEVKEGKNINHTYYRGEIKGLPANVNENNCFVYGLAKEPVTEYLNKLRQSYQDDDVITSMVDEDIPQSYMTRNDTYALIIGNQHYRFASDVPFARHDARIFAEYCKRTLGIPTEHIHLCEDATKSMILEQELEDWMGKDIKDKNEKRIIVYYAGHGVPDMKEHNKSYLLPTDIYGTSPKRGIALDSFYSIIGNMGFKQVIVFMDACFSGNNRIGESVNHGERGTEVEAADTKPNSGNMIVFCAAQGDETAQGFQEEGHGLFTYYLLKELKESNGSITYGRLAHRLEDNVSKIAPSLELRKKQTPTTKLSESLSEEWTDYNL
jgi:hypothetical protein